MDKVANSQIRNSKFGPKNGLKWSERLILGSQKKRFFLESVQNASGPLPMMFRHYTNPFWEFVTTGGTFNPPPIRQKKNSHRFGHDSAFVFVLKMPYIGKMRVIFTKGSIWGGPPCQLEPKMVVFMHTSWGKPISPIF